MRIPITTDADPCITDTDPDRTPVSILLALMPIRIAANAG
jgi:hypothetical protein